MYWLVLSNLNWFLGVFYHASHDFNDILDFLDPLQLLCAVEELEDLSVAYLTNRLLALKLVIGLHARLLVEP